MGGQGGPFILESSHAAHHPHHHHPCHLCQEQLSWYNSFPDNYWPEKCENWVKRGKEQRGKDRSAASNSDVQKILSKMDKTGGKQKTHRQDDRRHRMGPCQRNEIHSLKHPEGYRCIHYEIDTKITRSCYPPSKLLDCHWFFLQLALTFYFHIVISFADLIRHGRLRHHQQ